MRHAAESPPDNRFIIAQRGKRLHIEQLNPARLKERGKIARIVIGRKDEWMQRRHLSDVQRSPKFLGLLFFLCSVNFSALNSCAQCSLDRCQDLIASVRLLLMLLITVEPKCCVNSDKNENQFRCPAGQTRAQRFSLLFHRPYLFAAPAIAQTPAFTLMSPRFFELNAASGLLTFCLLCPLLAPCSLLATVSLMPRC